MSDKSLCRYISFSLLMLLIVFTIINFSLKGQLANIKAENENSQLDSLNWKAESYIGRSTNFKFPKEVEEGSFGYVVFTKQKSTCGKCLLDILQIWDKMSLIYKINQTIKPVIILERREYDYISIIESLGISNSVYCFYQPKFLSKIYTKGSQGIFFFLVNNKILLASELNIKNVEKIKSNFHKVINYANVSDNSF